MGSAGAPQAALPHHYGITFERSVLSRFADFDAMLELSPLGKVPVLILPGGERLWDSRAILDFLYGKAPLERLLLPREEPERHRVLRLEATALGLAEKAYERGLEFPRRARGTHDLAMVARLDRQIGSSPRWARGAAACPVLSGPRAQRG